MKHIALFLALALPLTQAFCPNGCSGHGTCDAWDRCTCFQGWTAFDCSDRSCPQGKAWFTPKPKSNAEKHNHGLAECSNRGTCDRATGNCICQAGFTGTACSLSECPNDCNGHGVCRRINDIHSEYVAWDAFKVYGCLCDGDFNNVKRRVDEVQEVKTDATGGDFTLTFDTSDCDHCFIQDTDTTPAIDHDASAEDVETALEALVNIDDVTVTFSEDGADSIWTITFVGDRVQGNVPLLVLDDTGLTGGGAHGVTLIQDGQSPLCWLQPSTCGGSGFGYTGSDCSLLKCKIGYDPMDGWVEETNSGRETYECSRRGRCDYATGLCKCFDGYSGDDCSTICGSS